MPKKVKKLRASKVKHKQKSAVQRTREQEYRKLRKRVENRLSKYRTKGYDVSYINIPSIPKRITEGSIKRLNKITTSYIRKHSTVATAMDISTGAVIKTVSGEEYFKEQQKISRSKGIETRKKRKSELLNRKENASDSEGSSYSRDYSNAPHIGDIMMRKIEDLISQYKIENSNLARTVKEWLDNANKAGVIDRLSQITDEQLNQLESDFKYVSQGRTPFYYGTDALHYALTGKNLSLSEWRKIEEGYESDFGADQFDEESFFGYSDDEDDY